MKKDFKIVPFWFAGEPQKRFAVVVDGKAVLLDRKTHPIRSHVAPYVARLRAGGYDYMATVLQDGRWSAFEMGRL